MLALTNKKSLILLIAALLAAVCSTLYYKNMCVTGACSYDLIMNIISPIEIAGYIISLIVLPFLFLPSKYFTTWLKYIFSWGFPLSIVLVNILHSETSWLVISKSDVVRMLGTVFGVLTLVVIVVQWYWSKK